MFGRPPQDFQAEEAWLNRAAEALRLLSELAALKATRLAPPRPHGAPLPGPEETAGPCGSEEADSQEVLQAAEGQRQQQAEAYWRMRRAAESLARQAELFAHHQSRPEGASALMRALELLGPWPAEGAGVSPEHLAAALGRVLRRQALAGAARQAPAPPLDWEELAGRIRRVVAGDRTVDLASVLGTGRSREEVIGLFLVVLELVRVGELWLVEQGAARIGLRRRTIPPS